MPIRIEHQPSPVAVGLAAWQTGQGAARERQQKYALNLFAQDQALRARREEQFGNRMTRGMGAFVSGLPEIPEYADPETANYLGKLRQSANILASGVHGFGPQVQGKLQGIAEEYNSRVGAIPKPSRAQQMQDETLYFDDTDKKWYDEPGPGRRAFAGGREIIDPQIVAQQQAEEERKQRREQRKADRQKAAEDAQKQQDAWWNGIVSNARKRYDAQDDDAFSGGTKQPLEWFINDEMRLDEEAKRVRPGGAGSTFQVDPTGATSPVQPMGTGPSPSATPTRPAAQPMGTQPPVSTGAPAIRKLQTDGSGRVTGIEGGQWSIEGQPNLGGGIRDAGPNNTNALSPQEQQLMGQIGEETNRRMIQPTKPTSEPIGSSVQEQLAGMLESGGVDTVRRLRQLAEIPKWRQALEEVFGVQIKPIGEIYPDAPQPERPPVRSIAQEHVTAETYRPGTGEGIPSDAYRLQDQILGAGGPTGRQKQREREEARMADGTVTTRMSSEIDEAEAAQRLEENRQFALAEMERRQLQDTLGITRDPNAVNQATKDRGAQAAQARAAAMTPEERDLQARAAAALERSRRPMVAPKYHVKPQSAAQTAQEPPAPTRIEREAAIENQRVARGVAKGNARRARLGKAPNVVQISSRAEYDMLPLGTYYIRDGQLKIKRTP